MWMSDYMLRMEIASMFAEEQERPPFAIRRRQFDAPVGLGSRLQTMAAEEEFEDRIAAMEDLP